VGHVRGERLIVGVADELRRHENDQLEVDARQLPDVMEEEMRPVLRGERRAVALAELREQSRVLVLLADEEREGARIRGVAGGGRFGVRSAKQERSATAFAELEV